jgi:sugar phosphate isomerase/epimerase
MFADGAERERLLIACERSCAAAAALGCPIVMSAVDKETGDTSRALASICQVGDIAYVQYSDVPRTGLRPGYTLDRLPPGEGAVDFHGILTLLAEKGYTGPLSYEAPNPAAWARDPVDVAREALNATRAMRATLQEVSDAAV